MKSGRRSRVPPPTEECGVWIDASELRKKRSRQALIPCTSSRFNPLARWQLTDSVLDEFTQTKSPLLHTRQTSMDSFFSPAGNRSKQSCVTEITTLPEETSSKLEERNAQEAPKAMKTSPTGPCWKPTCTEDQESVSLYKIRRYIEKPVSLGGNENEEWSCALGKPGDRGGGFSNASRFRSRENSPNDCAAGFGSEHQNILSPSSISKYPPKDYNTQDSLPSSQLFTQDTQGNRVICHRLMSAHSAVPLQDKTNVTWHTHSPMKGARQSLCDDDSLHKMFTQDSEGNVVIKH